MHEFRTVRELAIYVREKMDTYVGRELPLEFKKEFLALCYDANYRKKIFKATDFSAGFKTVLRDGRLELLKKILKEDGFYK